ncbi:MAG: response regulator transcription factor [Bacilli bacterium]|jgi:DNA-binding response OmpR family regulator|nr:response regulator transcription factor [Bacilli bacterium]
MKRIIIVDDDSAILDVMKKALIFAGYDVATFTSSIDAFYDISNKGYDLVIVDLFMQELNGIQLTKLIRKSQGDLPIIIITGSKEEDDELECLNLDVFDFIRKPISKDLFVAKVNRVFRKKSDGLNSLLNDENEELKVYPKKNLVYKNGIQVDLTRKEFELLVYFLNNKGRTVHRDEIISKVWEEDLEFISNRTIDVHVRQIRRKLNIYSISTVYGYGYRWND